MVGALSAVSIRNLDDRVKERLRARRDELGLPIEGFDAQIAAICRLHGATLATRNVKDFLETGVGLIDPWRP